MSYLIFDFGTVGAPAITWQYARPTSDIATNGWLGTSGGALYLDVDEVTRNDADYIYSPNNPTTQQFEMKFSTPTGTLGTTDNYWDYALEARHLNTTFDFDLVQNTTVLDSWSEAVTAGAGVVERSHAFSAGVMSTITDKADVRVRGVARAT